MVERSNQEWLDALRGPGRDEALAELRTLLVRGLGYALANQSGVDDSTLEDFAQEALLKILAGLDSFWGESRFTTWAQKIAVRVAFTELHCHRWRDVSLDEVTSALDADFIPDTLVDPSAGPEQQAVQRMLLSTLRRIIIEELTDRQRQAMIAVRIYGMPLEEVARRMGTNRNALYKLLYDARQRLQKRMMAEGLSPQDVLAAFGS
ncbi:MAG TPA: sigma-70 family RNA polymerase sigma factor [Anaerolineae bacterium]|nr:sigma-70 family RNA polymerase sigma factor [Anaerolineae bacterium]